MKRPLVLSLLVLVPAPAALADGCWSPCASGASSPGSKLLYVQPRGADGKLVVYDTRTRKRAFTLPPGMSSADGRWHTSAIVGARETWLHRFALPSNEAARISRVRGRWELGAVSSNGEWLALARSRNGATVVRVFDAVRDRTVHVVPLHGKFEVETVSPDGTRLFLIEHLAGRRYNVREYDLSRERLVANPLRASGVRIMAGYAWSGVASPDGTWLLTLYLSTARREAFVHSLNLERSAPACIALPSGRGVFAKLKRYSLTLAPNGKTLFAANPALGVVAEVDLVKSRVKRVARFGAAASHGAAASAAALSTISRNGRTLYFSAGRDLWAYDAAYGLVRGPYRTDGEIVGVGYGARDHRVYAVRAADGDMLAFQAATGKRLP